MWTYVAPSKIWTPDIHLRNEYVVKNCHEEFGCFTSFRFLRFFSLLLSLPELGIRSKEALCYCKVTTKKVVRKSRQKIEGEGDDNTTTSKKGRQKIEGQLL